MQRKGYLSLSPFLISEISSHFRDYFILQKIISDGYSFREFHREKKNYSLYESELSFIDDIIISIGSFDFVNVLPLHGINKETLTKIIDLEASYYFDFFDALHLIIADLNGSNLFITTDTPLLKSADSHNQVNSYKLHCARPSSLIKESKTN